MVVFTCNHCGESLKKGNVDKHNFRCRKQISVSCMDCFKDFDQESYSQHTQCVTELQRYSGKDYVAKANLNKGQKKQEAWVDLVRSITDKKTYLSAGVKKILETISNFDNIPRKKPKFMNFMKNSFRYMKVNELEEAWTLLEEAMKESKSENQNGKLEAVNGNGTANGKTEDGAVNGTAENGHKRKLEEEKPEEPEEPKNKRKKSEENEADEENGTTTGKFSWGETIKNILLSKDNELKLKKLRVKIKNKYQNMTGTEWNEKIEKKFNKKLSKLKGVVVEDEKIRLIE